MSCHESASCLTWAVLHGKSLNIGHYTQTIQPNIFLPVVHVGTIDFYHFIPYLLTLTLPGDTRSAQTKTSWIYFLALFIWSGWNLMWSWSNLSWTSWDHIWLRVIERREITDCFTDCVKWIKHWHAFRHLWINLIQIWYNDRYCCTPQFNTSLVDLDFDWRPQECETANISYSFCLVHSAFKAEALLMWFCFKQKNQHWLLYRPISLKLCLMIETTELYILISIWMILIFVEGHSWKKRKPLVSIFPTILGNDLDEIQYVATTCWFVEAHAKVMLHKYYSRERILLASFYEIFVNFIMCQDTCQPICSSLIWF